MDIKVENCVREAILHELERGRPGIDRPHTEAVIHHMKAICIENPNLDSDVLIIAAYAHDWGYADQFKDGQELQFQDVVDKKALHMELGAQKVEKFLRKRAFNFLTDEQKTRITHLVRIHDKLSQPEAEDEIALMEADCLGGLDINFYTPTFDKDSNEKYMNGVREKRLPKFRSKYGKQKFEELFKLRRVYYESQNRKD